MGPQARALWLVLIILGLSSCWERPTTEVPQSADPSTRMQGEYLVGLTDSATAESVITIFDEYGIKEWRRIGDRIFLLQVERDPGTATMDKHARQHVGIRYIEPNQVYTTQQPTDEAH